MEPCSPSPSVSSGKPVFAASRVKLEAEASKIYTLSFWSLVRSIPLVRSTLATAKRLAGRGAQPAVLGRAYKAAFLALADQEPELRLHQLQPNAVDWTRLATQTVDDLGEVFRD